MRLRCERALHGVDLSTRTPARSSEKARRSSKEGELSRSFVFHKSWTRNTVAAQTTRANNASVPALPKGSPCSRRDIVWLSMPAKKFTDKKRRPSRSERRHRAYFLRSFFRYALPNSEVGVQHTNILATCSKSQSIIFLILTRPHRTLKRSRCQKTQKQPPQRASPGLKFEPRLQHASNCDFLESYMC